MIGIVDALAQLKLILIFIPVTGGFEEYHGYRNTKSYTI